MSQQRKVGSCSHFFSCRGYHLPRCPILYFRISRYSTGTKTSACCKGPASTETLVQISWASRGWFNIIRSLFYLSPFKIDPLSVSFSSSMRLKLSFEFNSDVIQRTIKGSDFSLIWRLSKAAPPMTLRRRQSSDGNAFCFSVCPNLTMFISLEKDLWPKHIL